jgi:hypothetical protein
MASTSSPLDLPAGLEQAYRTLATDLQSVFGPRLHALVAFGPRLRSAVRRDASVRGDALALVDRVTIDDLQACAARAGTWDALGLRSPLILGREEFARSLDAFPLEYDDIIAHHAAVVGVDPFDGISVRLEDVRRACEARAKGHLVHLREGFLEARGRPAETANLILASASPLAALLGNVARLLARPADTPAQRLAAIADIPNLDTAALSRVLELERDPVLGSDEAVTLYPRYLASVERLVTWIDTWSRG